MASIRKRTLPSGKAVWQADYADAMGKRRHRQFQTKKEADAFMVNARSEVTTGVHVPDSASTTVSKAADDWLKAVEEDDLERSTVLHYQQHVELHIRPLIGGKKLTQVTTPVVYAFVDAMKKSGRSKETIRRAVQSLGRIFKFAKGRGLVGQNPVADVRLSSSKRGKKRPEMPTREELKTLLNTVTGRWRPLIVTATFTGLRASELRGLRWEDVDLKKAVLTVRQRADAWLEIGKPKTQNSSDRDVPLAPIVVNTLREWKLACPKGDLGLVFPTGAGQVEHHPNIVNRGWNPLQVKCGITAPMKDKKGDIKHDKDGNVVLTGKYNFHCLRHAAAALFIEQGMNPKRIQAVMGHASIQTTYDLYGYLFADEDADQKAVREIEARLLG